jgi:hypothetical protein
MVELVMHSAHPELVEGYGARGDPYFASQSPDQIITGASKRGVSPSFFSSPSQTKDERLFTIKQFERGIKGVSLFKPATKSPSPYP